MPWSLRRMTPADLPELLDGQHRGAVRGLAEVFDQREHPFPLDEIRDRWAAELQDRTIAAYVVTGADGRVDQCGEGLNPFSGVEVLRR